MSPHHHHTHTHTPTPTHTHTNTPTFTHTYTQTTHTHAPTHNTQTHTHTNTHTHTHTQTQTNRCTSNEIKHLRTQTKGFWYWENMKKYECLLLVLCSLTYPSIWCISTYHYRILPFRGSSLRQANMIWGYTGLFCL